MSVSGTTVTVTAVAKGSATITVKVAAGTNYSAPSNKTCSVSVTLPTSTLTDSSWATIREVSSAGKGANYWAVGDMKAIVINGKIGNEDHWIWNFDFYNGPVEDLRHIAGLIGA